MVLWSWSPNPEVLCPGALMQWRCHECVVSSSQSQFPRPLQISTPARQLSSKHWVPALMLFRSAGYLSLCVNGALGSKMKACPCSAKQRRQWCRKVSARFFLSATSVAASAAPPCQVPCRSHSIHSDLSCRHGGSASTGSSATPSGQNLPGADCSLPA